MNENQEKYGMLLGVLYSEIQSLYSITNIRPEQRGDMMANMINEFYKKNKERFNIRAIDDVLAGLDKVKQAIEQKGNQLDVR